MEAKRAIDTSLSVSKEQNTERQGLKMNENVSNAQSNENVVGPWPGIICQLDLFQRPKFNQLGVFFFSLPFSYHLQHSERKRFPFNGKSVFHH